MLVNFQNVNCYLQYAQTHNLTHEIGHMRLAYHPKRGREHYAERGIGCECRVQTGHWHRDLSHWTRKNLQLSGVQALARELEQVLERVRVQVLAPVQEQERVLVLVLVLALELEQRRPRENLPAPEAQRLYGGVS
jgi:hypothetical protein